MIIGRATIEDAEQILALQHLSYQSEAEIYNDYTLAALNQTLAELVDEFDDYVFLKAVINDRIIGSVRGRMQDGACYVGRLIVHPDYQNQGIGSKLMTEIEACFPEAHVYQVFTGHKSKRNIIIYQKLGYKISGTEPVTKDYSLKHMTKSVETRASAPESGEAGMPSR